MGTLEGAIIILIGIRLDTNTTSRMRVGILLAKKEALHAKFVERGQTCSFRVIQGYSVS